MISIRHNGTARIETRDSRRPLSMRDFLLDTDTRLTAEPAPPAPDLGVRWDGSSSKAVDVDAIFTGFVDAIGVLSPAEIAKIKSLMMKYAGSPTSTNQVGITTSDTTSDAARAREVVRELSDTNADFWEKRHAAEDLRLFGR